MVRDVRESGCLRKGRKAEQGIMSVTRTAYQRLGREPTGMADPRDLHRKWRGRGDPDVKHWVVLPVADREVS